MISINITATIYSIAGGSGPPIVSGRKGGVTVSVRVYARIHERWDLFFIYHSNWSR